jgi:hypothetical protein
MDNENATRIADALESIATSLEKLASTVQWNVGERDDGIVVRIINHGDSKESIKMPQP